MEPAAPAPSTRAEARNRSKVVVDKSGNRARVVRVMAQATGAVVGAFIVLGIASLAGSPSTDSPAAPVSELDQVAVPTPRPTVRPSTSQSPSAQPTPPDEAAEPIVPEPIGPDATAPLAIAPEVIAPDPAPEPSETIVPPEIDQAAAESQPGKSGLAPGRNKPPTKP